MQGSHINMNVAFRDCSRAGPLPLLEVSGEDRAVLERWTPRRTVSQELALRARIVLAAAAGASNRDIAAAQGCNIATVGRWRRRYLEQGIGGLLDEPRVGRPREIGDDKIEQIIVDTLEQAP